MIERTHGVEGVRCAHCAFFDAQARFGGSGVGVAYGDADSTRGGMRDQFGCAEEFGRDSHQAHVALGCVEELIESCNVWREKMSGGLHPALGVRKKRSLEMNADRASVAFNGRFRDQLRKA